MNRSQRKEAISSMHQDNILRAAEELFSEKGFSATTMDDIARQAEYSKRTVYLQFSSKEEIHDRLVLKGFTGLKEAIARALADSGDFVHTYRILCKSLLEFQETSPYLFAGMVDFQTQPLEGENGSGIKREIFAAGEEINSWLEQMLARGIEDGFVRPDTRVKETILVFWSSLSSLILVARRKSSYIAETMGTPAEDLLDYGFHLLLRMILKEERMTRTP